MMLPMAVLSAGLAAWRGPGLFTIPRLDAQGYPNPCETAQCAIEGCDAPQCVCQHVYCKLIRNAAK
jgi:hypothetical protein